jgi:hypothetical protein
MDQIQKMIAELESVHEKEVARKLFQERISKILAIKD